VDDHVLVALAHDVSGDLTSAFEHDDIGIDRRDRDGEDDRERIERECSELGHAKLPG